ncbi:hypothetical protein OC846_003572 [Tilletia horrida]|uniref:Secreted protein n=1 Tax=Tilletia horrida TaxID=155126 RepID=A0AAN6JRM2_9BASI|nr:hypothetical protein OC846_003572 [Tilletia horrida]
MKFFAASATAPGLAAVVTLSLAMLASAAPANEHGLQERMPSPQTTSAPAKDWATGKGWKRQGGGATTSTVPTPAGDWKPQPHWKKSVEEDSPSLEKRHRHHRQDQGDDGDDQGNGAPADDWSWYHPWKRVGHHGGHAVHSHPPPQQPADGPAPPPLDWQQQPGWKRDAEEEHDEAVLARGADRFDQKKRLLNLGLGVKSGPKKQPAAPAAAPASTQAPAPASQQQQQDNNQQQAADSPADDWRLAKAWK